MGRRQAVDAEPSAAAKRVRFAEPAKQAEDSERRIGLTTGGASAQQGTLPAHSMIESADGSLGSRPGFQYYSLDDVDDSGLGERCNHEALVQMRQLLDGCSQVQSNDSANGKEATIGSARKSHARVGRSSAAGSSSYSHTSIRGNEHTVPLSHLLEDKDNQCDIQEQHEPALRARQPRRFRKAGSAMDAGTIDCGTRSSLDELD